MKKTIFILFILSVFSLMTAAACLIPVSDMVINTSDTLCNGTYDVKGLILDYGVNLYFSENTILNYTGNETAGIINLQGNNTLDCADSWIYGNSAYDIQGININMDNVIIQNCRLDHLNTGIPANFINNINLNNVYLGPDFAVRSLRFYDSNNIVLSYVTDDGSSRLSGSDYLIYNSTFTNDLSLGFASSGLSGNINNNNIGVINVFWKHETEDLFISDNIINGLEVVTNDGDYTNHNLYVFSNTLSGNIIDDPLDYNLNEWIDYCLDDQFGNLGVFTYSGNNINPGTCAAQPLIIGPAAIILNLFIFLFIVAGLIMASGGFESLMDGSKIRENLVRIVMILVFSMILQTFISTALGL